MGFYKPGICIDSFEPEPDRLVRVRRYDVEETYDLGEIVAIDDSETSRSALAEALHIARTSKAKLYITHVADETMLNIHGHALASVINLENAVATLTQAGQKLLDRIRLSRAGAFAAFDFGRQRVMQLRMQCPGQKR